MGRLGIAFILFAAAVLAGCGRQRPASSADSAVTVGAAANLTAVLDEIGKAFTGQTGIRVVMSYASTAQLAQQIENSAPFDIFAAADTQHVDSLIRSGKILADSRAIYARGVLALWIPKSDTTGVTRLEDLGGAKVRFVAIAMPSVAPYGKAAVEALQKASLWKTIEPKVVYSSNISMAKQYAAS